MPECFRASFETKLLLSLIALRFSSNVCQTCKLEPAHGLPTSTTTLERFCRHCIAGSCDVCSWTMGRTCQWQISYRIMWNIGQLVPGDVVLADGEFDITESVGMMQAKLHIPSFTNGKGQLSAMELDETKTIENVNIHVEWVIGNVRQKYSIL